MAVTELTERDRALVDWLAGQRFGSVEVADVEPERRPDSAGDMALVLTVTLPLDGRATWPIQDLYELEFAVRDRAIELGVQWPWYVTYRPPAHEDVPQVEDEQPVPPPMR